MPKMVWYGKMMSTQCAKVKKISKTLHHYPLIKLLAPEKDDVIL